MWFNITMNYANLSMKIMQCIHTVCYYLHYKFLRNELPSLQEYLIWNKLAFRLTPWHYFFVLSKFHNHINFFAHLVLIDFFLFNFKFRVNLLRFFISEVLNYLIKLYTVLVMYFTHNSYLLPDSIELSNYSHSHTRWIT